MWRGALSFLPFSWKGVYLSSPVSTGSVQRLLEAFLLGLAACVEQGDLIYGRLEHSLCLSPSACPLPHLP